MPASELPASELPGRGGIEVSLHAKLGDGLDGVQAYMSGYPYNCLEQSLSRAVALHDRATWDAEMTTLAAYMDRDGLLKYFATDALPGEDTLTAYVLTIANETGWAIPEAQRKRLIDGLGNFVQGKIVRGSALPTADLAVRKLAAIDALARFNAAQPAMLDSITLEPNLWPTSAVLDWLSILRRVPRVAKPAAKRDTALGILRTRLNFQGTTMGFSTSRTDALWWLMVSEDSNAARTLIEVLDQAAWREDVPRLVRGLLGRQQRGHWNTTVANAWGTVAMQKFAKAFAASAVTGSTSVSYGQQHETVSYAESTHAAKPTNSQVLTLPWQPGTLPLSMVHTGTGAPWVMIRTTAAMPLTSALSSGYAITRTLSALEQRVPGKWSRGDVVRVRLSIDAQSDMTWVVVEDPVPGGATLLGTGLGGQSQLLAQGERREGWAWRAFEERTFDVFRAYYRFVPKGKFTVEYTLRLNNAGKFQLPATRVEAMYAPEMFGELPNATVVVAAP